MSRTNDLTPPIDDTVELLTIAFDFGLILIANEIINSVISMAAATYSGIDNTPNNRFIGSPAIITSPKTNAALAAVSQQVGNMIAGVTYRLQCVVHTSLGNQPSLWTQFSCVATNVPTFVPIGGATQAADSGAGGMTASSMAAMTAITASGGGLPANGTTVLMTAPYRFGLFTFTTSNISAAVTNDPNQGINAAPSFGDTTGASGGWVRAQQNPWNPRWFGFRYDGLATFPLVYGTPTIISGTDNGPAFAAMMTYAQYVSSLGQTVIIEDVPGYEPGANCVLWSMDGAAPSWLFHGLANIKVLRWNFNGVIYQNSSTTPTNAHVIFPQTSGPLRDAANNAVCSLIATTNVAVQILNASTLNYNPATGTVTVPLLNGQQGLGPGSIFTTSGLGGTGAYAAANVTNGIAGQGTIPAGSASILSASYNTSGLVTLEFETAPGLVPGSTFYVAGLTGTGSFASANTNSAVASAGTSGTTVTYSIASGLTMTLNNGVGTATWNALLAYTIATGLTMTLSAAAAQVQQGNSNTVIVNNVSAGFTGNFNVGDWVGLASSDMSFYGYPPSPYQFEFVNILSITLVGTGAVVGLNQTIRFEHRADFIDDANGIGVYTEPCGAARIWALNTSGWSASPYFYPFDILSWDSDIEYYNARFGCPLGEFDGWQFTGRSTKTFNYVGMGDAPSVVGYVEHNNFRFLINGEPDKWLDQLIYRNGVVDFATTGETLGGFRYQSGANSLLVENVDFKATPSVGVCAGKNTTFRNCHIPLLSNSSPNGFLSSVVVDNCAIDSAPQFNLMDGGFNPLVIDGTNVAWGTAGQGAMSKAGTITINKAAFTPNGIGGYGNLYPGTTLNFAATATVGGAHPTYLFTGAAGNARVLRQYEDPAGSVSIASGTYIGDVSIATASYNTSGLVTLTTTTPHGLVPGSTFAVSALTGTGSFASANTNSAVASAGTSGTTLTYSIAANLTMTLNNGVGTVAAGLVTLTTTGPHGIQPGLLFSTASLTGTGSFATANVTNATAAAGTSGTTLTFTVSPNLGATTITGGVVSWVSGPYAYIDTTWPYATLPSWANGAVFPFRGGAPKFRDCFGGTGVRGACLANLNGLDYWEYYKYEFGGVFSSAFAWIGTGFGTLKRLVVTPQQNGSNAATYLTLSFTTFDSTNNFAQDTGGMVIKINIGVGGQRDIGYVSAAGIAGTDYITLSGELTVGSINITSASYNNSTGNVTLVCPVGSPVLAVGSNFAVAGLTASVGSATPANISNATAVTGTSGTTYVYNIGTGLGTITFNSNVGTVGVVSSTTPFLSPNKLIATEYTMNVYNLAGTDVGDPVFDIEPYFDCGYARKPLVSCFDGSSKQNMTYASYAQLV